MNLLLDTHTLIWFLNGDKRISVKARNAIQSTNNFKYISIATIWEIAIKISLNKFRFSKGFANFLSLIEDNGIELLPMTFEHALILSSLEFIHRDPFDRFIVAQCLVENFTLLTKDEKIKKYNIKTLW